MGLKVTVTNAVQPKQTRESNKILGRTAIPKDGPDPFAPQSAAQKVAYAKKAEAVVKAEEKLKAAIASKPNRRDAIIAKENNIDTDPSTPSLVDNEPVDTDY